MLWTYVISDFKCKEIIGAFYEKELQKTNSKGFGVGKIRREEAINCMLNGKAMIVLLTVVLMKKT